MWCPAQAGVGCPARRPPHQSRSSNALGCPASRDPPRRTQSARQRGARRKPGWDALRDGLLINPHHPTLSAVQHAWCQGARSLPVSVVPGASRGGMPCGTASSSIPIAQRSRLSSMRGTPRRIPRARGRLRAARDRPSNQQPLGRCAISHASLAAVTASRLRARRRLGAWTRPGAVATGRGRATQPSPPTDGGTKGSAAIAA
jgi:hypothetical protein